MRTLRQPFDEKTSLQYNWVAIDYYWKAFNMFFFLMETSLICIMTIMWQDLFATRLLWDMSFILQQPLWDWNILGHDVFPTTTTMRHDHFETWCFSYKDHYETWPFWDMVFFLQRPLWDMTILRHDVLPTMTIMRHDHFETCESLPYEKSSGEKDYTSLS